MDWASVAVFSFAHAVNDGYLDTVPPLWPRYMQVMGLSKTLVGLLSSALWISCNAAQPFLGLVLDRYRYRGVAAIGLAIALMGVAAAGTAATLPQLLAALVLMGFGTALYHPSALAWVGQAAAARRATALSIFAFTGSMGFALGAIVGPLLYRWREFFGLTIAAFLALPVALMVLVAERRQPKPGHRPLSTVARSALASLPLVGPVLAVAVIRSGCFDIFSTYLPILSSERGLSLIAGGAILTIFLMLSAVGSLAGGALADRIGRKPVTIATLLAAGPLLALAPVLSGWPALALLFAGGLAIRASESATMALCQELMPDVLSTASGLMIGGAWALAAMFIPAAGLIADRSSLTVALCIAGLLPLLAALPAAFMKESCGGSPNKPAHSQ